MVTTKKVYEKKVLNFGTQKSCGKKCPWNKKSLEIKSYHFRTLFFRTFFLVSVQCMGTKDVYYHAKKRAIDIKTPLVIFNMQKKVLFIKNVSDLTSFSQDYGLFFLQDFNFCDLISWDVFYFREKSSKNLKLRTLFPVTFCPRTLDNWDFFTKSYFFQVFFQKLFFRWLSLINSTKMHWNVNLREIKKQQNNFISAAEKPVIASFEHKINCEIRSGLW